MGSPNPNSLDFIVESSVLAREDGSTWSHTSIPGRWWVPEIITLEDQQLFWEPNTEAGRWVEPSPELLNDFLQIHQYPQWEQWHEANFRFARKWGPLHLCQEHGRPVWHQQDQWPLPVGEKMLTVCPPKERADGCLFEPIWRWHAYSLLARQVVEASVRVREGKPMSTTQMDVRTANRWAVKPDRDALVARVGSLIEDGGGFAVRPEWESEGEVPIWRAEVRTLAAALGVALWNILRSSPGIGVCAHCLRLFEARQRNQRYCSRPACQTERKRVEKAELRAKKAAVEAGAPEYSI